MKRKIIFFWKANIFVNCKKWKHGWRKIEKSTKLAGENNHDPSLLFESLPCVSGLFISDAHLVIRSFHKRSQQRDAQSAGKKGASLLSPAKLLHPVIYLHCEAVRLSWALDVNLLHFKTSASQTLFTQAYLVLRSQSLRHCNAFWVRPGPAKSHQTLQPSVDPRE